MKKINFGEAIIILVLMLAILGTGVIGFGLSPQVPVLFVVALLIAWAKVKKATWEKVHDGDHSDLYLLVDRDFDRGLDQGWYHSIFDGLWL